MEFVYSDQIQVLEDVMFEHLKIGFNAVAPFAKHGGMIQMKGTLGEQDPRTGLIKMNIDLYEAQFDVADLIRLFEAGANSNDVIQAPNADGLKSDIAQTVTFLKTIQSSGRDEIKLDDKGPVCEQIASLANGPSQP